MIARSERSTLFSFDGNLPPGTAISLTQPLTCRQTRMAALIISHCVPELTTGKIRRVEKKLKTNCGESATARGSGFRFQVVSRTDSHDRAPSENGADWWHHLRAFA